MTFVRFSPKDVSWSMQPHVIVKILRILDIQWKAPNCFEWRSKLKSAMVFNSIEFTVLNSILLNRLFWINTVQSIPSIAIGNRMHSSTSRLFDSSAFNLFATYFEELICLLLQLIWLIWLIWLFSIRLISLDFAWFRLILFDFSWFLLISLDFAEKQNSRSACDRRNAEVHTTVEEGGAGGARRLRATKTVALMDAY